ncbi:family 78 glycoside hydrolase catalytic domain [Paenarthrobacter sp. NPDC057981]|uniref:alpha-L-rhamnosidase n=1 Tax=Paenarthrobacter sp. NPDC057981 TaxID=3346297 RepID=UPI0036DEAA22
MTADINATPVELLAKASWITAAAGPIPPAGTRPAYEFRTTFTLGEDIGGARLAATAHGVYEAFINGTRVGDEELSPGLTSYATTLYVQHHDVSELLRNGTNELRLVLSDGWFRGRCGPSRIPDGFGTSTAICAQLLIQTPTEDLIIATGPDWEYGTGAITAADLMDGQTIDFTRIDNIRWQPASIADDPMTLDTSRLAFSPAPPVRRIRDYPPRAVTKLPGGRQIVDFGQNLNGWVRLSALGAAGTKITLTHGEALDSHGDLTTAHLAYTPYPDPEPLPVGQIDTVISRGRPGDVFEPRHTTHGFRYVAVDGLSEDLSSKNITAVLVHTDLEPTGTFECSDQRLNELHRIAEASWRSNACDVPTDCPQRERWGYTGDYQIFVRSAAFLDNILGFSRKWLRSLADDQLDNGCITNVAPNTGVVSNPDIPFSFDGSAGWGDAATIVPWQLYVTYGDARVLEENFDMMTGWVDYISEIAAAGRHPSREQARPDPAAHERFLWDSGFHWGEWAEPGGVFDYAADKGVIATAYMARSADIVSKAAAILGRDDLAHRYRELHSNTVGAWRTEYLTASDGHLKVESQANYVRGLAFGLIPENAKTKAVERLVALIREKDTHLSTGFLSTPFLLPALADHGRTDIAYELLFQDTSPSWMTMLNRGATTIWESWEGIADDGTPHESLNHYSKGSVITFLHEYVAGIRAEEDHPGYEQFSIEPRPGHGIEWAQASLRTVRGRITSSWQTHNAEFKLEVGVPDGASARIVMPSGTKYTAGPGSHTFKE